MPVRGSIPKLCPHLTGVVLNYITQFWWKMCKRIPVQQYHEMIKIRYGMVYSLSLNSKFSYSYKIARTAHLHLTPTDITLLNWFHFISISLHLN